MQFFGIDEKPVKIEEKELIFVDPFHMMILMLALIPIFSLIFFLSGCETKQEGIPTSKGEYVYRQDRDSFFPIEPPLPQPLPVYPWDEKSKKSDHHY